MKYYHTVHILGLVLFSLSHHQMLVVPEALFTEEQMMLFLAVPDIHGEPLGRTDSERLANEEDSLLCRSCTFMVIRYSKIVELLSDMKICD